MIRTPHEDDWLPASPQDFPGSGPVGYVRQDGDMNLAEAYDKGLGEILDFNPYRPYDDPLKLVGRSVGVSPNGLDFYTLDHGIIRRWAEYRYGHPAEAKDGPDDGSLFIHFDGEGPIGVDVKRISWCKFFRKFDEDQLALVFRTKTRTGGISNFYKFVSRQSLGQSATARKPAP